MDNKPKKKRGRPKIERIDVEKFMAENPAVRLKLEKQTKNYTDIIRTIFANATVDAKVIVSFQLFPRKE